MMTPEQLAKLKKSITLHEGYSKFPYTDTVGKITIGYGYNLTDRGLSDIVLNNLYLEDIQYFYNQLSQFDWYPQLTPDRQIALIDMAFMGWKKFLTFNKMIKALSQGDYEQAAFEMLHSKWAKQASTRAITLAHVILTGVYDL
jgi:lysozyme